MRFQPGLDLINGKCELQHGDSSWCTVRISPHEQKQQKSISYDFTKVRNCCDELFFIFFKHFLIILLPNDTESAFTGDKNDENYLLLSPAICLTTHV